MPKITKLEIFQPRPRMADVINRPQAQRNSDVYNTGGLDAGSGSGAGGGGNSQYTGDPSGTGTISGQPACVPASDHFQVGPDTVDGQVSSVYFDGLLADPDQYTISGNTIVPVTTLVSGTQITYIGKKVPL